MKTVKINSKTSKEEIKKIVDEAADFLKKGMVVAMPTDTIYGLHALASSSKGVNKIIKIKERPEGFGFIHLMESYCQVHEYCFVSKKQDEFLRTMWPASTRELKSKEVIFKKKPTTFILKSRNKFPKISSGGRDTVAVRLPKNELMQAILKAVKEPIVSSSLNVTGGKHIGPSEIEKEMKILPDMVIDCGKIGKTASRVIDITDINNIKILRN
jgi:L-threonylcarbamoyladenylate synthase